MFSYVITVGALLSSAGSIFAKCGRVRFLASLVDGVTSENSCALLQSLLISPSVFVKWLGDSTAASPTRFSKIREIVSFCVCVLNQVKKKKKNTWKRNLRINSWQECQMAFNLRSCHFRF